MSHSADLSLASRVITRLIRTYQRLTAHRVAPCRFYPSCSAYALEAVETHGALRGAWLALKRISKCRPLGPHGIDLVPPPSAQKGSR
jgi:uncharacterized protein